VTQPRGAVVVFAKAPHAGGVKTRMSPPLTLEQAAELYGCMLDDVLVATAEFAAGLGLEPVLAVYPAEAVMELAARVPHDFRIVAQRGKDLSERMGFAVAEAAAGGARCVVLRSSDSPTLDGDAVAAALDRLEENDLVVCPDQDGGYSLVGLRRPTPGVFDHEMSTTSVLEDTLENAAQLGLRTHVLGESFDIDTGDDLTRLAAARDQGGATLCPRTIAYLDENGLWP
jgi:hypothetical protein